MLYVPSFGVCSCFVLRRVLLSVTPGWSSLLMFRWHTWVSCNSVAVFKHGSKSLWSVVCCLSLDGSSFDYCRFACQQQGLPCSPAISGNQQTWDLLLGFTRSGINSCFDMSSQENTFKLLLLESAFGSKTCQHNNMDNRMGRQFLTFSLFPIFSHTC